MQDLINQLSTVGYHAYPASVRTLPSGSRIFVVGKGINKYVGVDGDVNLGVPSGEAAGVKLYTMSWGIYQKLGEMIGLKPGRCSKRMSFGTGDRLGLATPAHVGVVGPSQAFPVLAQQSPRELGLTHRIFKRVMFDAALGVLESGYRGDWGADADHIKAKGDLDEAIEAGYTMYTLDLSDWTTDICARPAEQIGAEAEALSAVSRGIIGEWTGKQIAGVEFSKRELAESAVIYEKALQQVGVYNQKLAARLDEYDLEISIDEGTRMTTMADHLFVAEYLRRSDIPFFSLAPRFPGEFQKGIDYVGAMDELRQSFNSHAAISRALGGYRLSLHSGSDKFSVYGMFNEATGGHFHVKTSGTSWLEAVGAVALSDRALFAQMYHTCLDKLDDNKKLYHIFITVDDFPKELPEDIAPFYKLNDVRQLFHVSYGALLDAYGEQIKGALASAEDQHYAAVRSHIGHHLEKLRAA